MHATLRTPRQLLAFLMAPLIAVAMPLFGVGVAHAGGALDLTDRQVSAGPKLDVNQATKVAAQLVELDSQAEATIYLVNTVTNGSAQGVMLVADTIRSLRSPVVMVVTTQVHGPGAALAVLGDRLVMYRSAGLVFTELDYEGVKKPEDKTKKKKKKKKKVATKPAAPPADAPPEAGEAAPGTPPPAEEEEEEDEEEEVDPEERLLQQVRQSYLETTWAAVARRLGYQLPFMLQTVKDGGFVLTSAEAVKQKVAFSVVERITYTQLPKTKKEVKVTTIEKKVRTAIPPNGH